ncbi:hypothetical protein KFK09_008694 [Dendrobium nobile]|uniref:CCHC-type domain-containing protein n=1 Tax=Dendrobium nobile TaxID=94219 RepID=A0A8T3BPP6_DENNO|nr:hypothetical protein KFK09_008694 [Dendrobium nobile]
MDENCNSHALDINFSDKIINPRNSLNFDNCTPTACKIGSTTKETDGNGVLQEIQIIEDLGRTGTNVCAKVQDSLDVNLLNSDLLKVRDCEAGELGNCSIQKEIIDRPKILTCNSDLNVWKKKANIKVSDLNFGENFTKEDGVVKLHVEKEIENSNRLQKALVIKVFGNNVPFNVISIELRKQWSRIGKFHLTQLGLGWVLCAFEEQESLEEIIASDPWYVNGNIVGMDRWTASFSPTSFKELIAPIWIRMPNLPLQCWDEVNVCRIASMVGYPYLIDRNMFQWSRREFARVCVRVKLDEQLPLGVWVEGELGKFYQNIEYERLPTFCFKCGKLGHLREECLKKSIPVIIKLGGEVSKVDKVSEPTSKSQVVASNIEVNKEMYGPWIHVDCKKKENSENSF